MLKKIFKSLHVRNFEKNKRRINLENQFGVTLILFFLTVIILINVLGEFFGNDSFFDILHMPRLMAQAIYVGVALLLYFFVLRKRRNVNYTLWIYLIETPMLMITLIGGTVAEPNQMTFTFLFYLLLFPILILDKPSRVIGFVLCFAVAYGILDYMAKPSAIFARDFMHLFNVTLMTIAACLYVLSVRIRNIEFASNFEEKAEHDPLTGLYNRSGARHLIDAHLPGILIYIDLDQFKGVNDRFGHAAGDDVLVKVADVLRANFRKEDILIRLGGDEFAVYASGTWDNDAIERKLSGLIDSFHTICRTTEDGETLVASASVGCVNVPHGCESLDVMIKAADEAMYRVKNDGKNNYGMVTI